MQHRYLALLLLAASQFAVAADDFKVIKLEQDVRNLEQQVRELSRQVAELQRNSDRPDDRSTPADRQPPAATGTPPWLDAKHWDRVRIGMSELEVIGILGPPTSLRGTDAGSRTLFYALEIGTDSFLGGQVRLQERRVTQIDKPTLK